MFGGRHHLNTKWYPTSGTPMQAAARFGSFLQHLFEVWILRGKRLKYAEGSGRRTAMTKRGPVPRWCSGPADVKEALLV